MIQYLLGMYGNAPYTGKALYLQADHFLVGRSSLYEIADEFYKLGGELICFDEIHKYPEWSMELKSIYDTFPNLKILASGSSALEYTLNGPNVRSCVHRRDAEYAERAQRS